MRKVVFDISMSLDGFMTASDIRPDEPMGEGGQRLHEWAFGGDDRSSELLARSAGSAGAVIAGRRTYDSSLPWWGADGPTGAARLPHPRLPTCAIECSTGRPDRRSDAGFRHPAWDHRVDA